MLRPRDLLNRFRRSGAPGAAGGTGVPVKGDHDPAAELAALFADLETTERRCREVREDGDARAERARAAAENEARDLVDRSRVLQDTERAAVVARMRGRSEAEAAASARTAERRAQEILERAERNRGHDVGLVLARVRDLIDERPGAGEQ